jgi:hypothetical protein
MSAKNLKPDQGPCAQAALVLLLGHRACAALRGRGPQEGAVAWPALQEAAGVDAACLQSLLAAGLIQGADGPGAPGGPHPQSRFVLTVAGWQLALRVAAAPVGPRLAAQTCRRAPAPDEKPRWDRVTRELWFAGAVVLRFRRGARNQQRALDAFEEQGWPPAIGDPLPRQRRVKARERLRDTVRHLNARLEGEALHFRADAEGQAVFWSFSGI